MKIKIKQNWVLPPTFLRFLIVILLILGVFFRFVNLDKKVYWNDEVYTSLRISGYTNAEILQQVFDGHEIDTQDLQKYQRTNSERNLIDTIKSLAIEDPHHPPLYYVMARFWVKWFGNSVAVTRSLSALISLLVFPCIYWLCLELFDSPLTGWVAIALIAVSPFHVLYAQEAREYSLWTVTILLSSASLLQAIRLKTKRSWVIYTASLALGLYSFLFSVFVSIGHGIYVFTTERFRLSKTVTAYLLASFAGLIIFLPWLLVTIINLHQVQDATDWTQESLAMLPLVKTWLRNLNPVFLDLSRGNQYFLPLILVLVGYSIYFLCRTTPKQTWLFILTLIGPTALALILPDLILGGQRATVARYLIPCYLGIQLAIAYLFATKISNSYLNIWRQKLWQIITIALISGGILSCTLSSQAEIWWNKSHSKNVHNPQVARIINQANHPLVISDSSPSSALSLSYLLDPKVRFQLVLEPNIPKICDGFSDVFLFNASNALQYRLQKELNYKIEPIYLSSSKFGQPGRGLWRLEK